jgi:SAM-dependent methyltransferase
MRQDERAPFVAALQRAREAAYPSGEYVGQESFMRASEIRRLAARAGIGRDVPVLDACCGTGGPGRLIAAETGCSYLGVDYSAGAVRIARDLAHGLPCRFETALLPPLPDGDFEVVLLLETMLAFPDKRALLRDVTRVLRPGGRFAFTIEEGRPLTRRERGRMPDADTVSLTRRSAWTAGLREVGLTVSWQEDCSAGHHATAAALLQCFRAEVADVVRHIGRQAADELLAAHELWTQWLGSGRVRKVAVVAEKR